MDQDERAAAPLSGQICPDHRLAHAGRGNENTVLIGEKRPGRRVLNARQFAAEGDLKGFSTHPLVLHVEGDSVFAQQRLELRTASPRKAHVPCQVLCAGDHPRRHGGGETHALPLVELRVLEGGEPLDLVQQRRG